MLTSYSSISVTVLFSRLDTSCLPQYDLHIVSMNSFKFTRKTLLQIYNEQITDLLDPNQRNLQVILDAPLNNKMKEKNR